MELCKTDIKKIIRLLDKSAVLIDKYCGKPCEQDVSRMARNMSKKLNKKLKEKE